MNGRARSLVAVAISGALAAVSPARADLPVSLLSTGSADRGLQSGEAGTWHAADPGSDRVVFSTAVALEPEDRDSETDVYQRAGGRTRLLTPTAAPSGTPAGNVAFVAASGDAARVLVTTYEPLTLDDSDKAQDVYLCDADGVRLATPGTPTEVAAMYDGDHYVVTRDVRRLLVRTTDKLDAADQNATSDLYVVEDGRYTLVSGGRAGEVVDLPLGVEMSADGRRVAFASTARLRPDTDGDDIADVYLWQDGGGYEQLTPPGAGGPAFPPYVMALSADGSRAAVTSYDRITADDGDDLQDIFRVGPGSIPVRVSRGAQQPTESGGLVPTVAGAAADLSRIWFATRARHDPADTDTWTDIYVWSGGTAELATPGTTQEVGIFTPMPYGGVRDGTGYVFATGEALSPQDRNDQVDIYEAAPGAPPRLRSDGLPGQYTELAMRGVDGSLLLSTRAPMLAADTDGRVDLYLRGADGSTERVTPGNAQLDATFSGATEDLRRVGFVTREGLVGSDDDDGPDLYGAGAATDPVAPPGSTAPPGTSPNDTTAPVVERLRLSRSRFRSARRRATIAAVRRRPIGALLRFSASEPGETRITVARVRGRRLRRVAGTIRLRALAGENRIRFRGSLDGRRRLASGRYELAVRVADAAGNVSRPRSVRFTIVRR